MQIFKTSKQNFSTVGSPVKLGACFKAYIRIKKNEKETLPFLFKKPIETSPS